MKRRTVKILAVLIVCGLGLNYAVSRKANLGLRSFINSPELKSDGTYRYIGPSTQHALSQFKGTEYTITVLPLDWFEHDLKVTHTAFVRSSGQEVWLRLRLNPFGLPFDIVGYTDRLRSGYTERMLQ